LAIVIWLYNRHATGSFCKTRPKND